MKVRELYSWLEGNKSVVDAVSQIPLSSVHCGRDFETRKLAYNIILEVFTAGINYYIAEHPGDDKISSLDVSAAADSGEMTVVSASLPKMSTAAVDEASRRVKNFIIMTMAFSPGSFEGGNGWNFGHFGKKSLSHFIE